MANKQDYRFWNIAGLSLAKDDRLYYNISIKDQSGLMAEYDFWDRNLFSARCRAVENYLALSRNISPNSRQIVELNLRSFNDKNEVSEFEIELVSTLSENRDLIYQFYPSLNSMPDEFDLSNHWMNTASFEFDHYVRNQLHFEGKIERLIDCYIDVTVPLASGTIHVLPGTSQLYKLIGLTSQISGVEFDNKIIGQLINSKK
jgi:hypothetical protein